MFIKPVSDTAAYLLPGTMLQMLASPSPCCTAGRIGQGQQLFPGEATCWEGNLYLIEYINVIYVFVYRKGASCMGLQWKSLPNMAGCSISWANCGCPVPLLLPVKGHIDAHVCSICRRWCRARTLACCSACDPRPSWWAGLVYALCIWTSSAHHMHGAGILLQQF